MHAQKVLGARAMKRDELVIPTTRMTCSLPNKASAVCVEHILKHVSAGARRGIGTREEVYTQCTAYKARELQR